jgi:hypothetical protein
LTVTETSNIVFVAAEVLFLGCPESKSVMFKVRRVRMCRT